MGRSILPFSVLGRPTRSGRGLWERWNIRRQRNPLVLVLGPHRAIRGTEPWVRKIPYRDPDMFGPQVQRPVNCPPAIWAEVIRHRALRTIDFSREGSCHTK